MTSYEVAIGITGSGFFQQVIDVGLNAEHTFTGLNPDEDYAVRVVSLDAAGNRSAGYCEGYTEAEAFLCFGGGPDTACGKYDIDGNGIVGGQDLGELTFLLLSCL